MFKGVVRALVLLSAVGAAAAIYLYTHTPRGGPSRLGEAIVGCNAVKYAAEGVLALGAPSAPCPSVADLVASGRLSPGRRRDPWGAPYVLRCRDGVVHVLSAGADQVVGTEDDLRDDLSPSEVEQLKNIHARRAHD